jgi:hypothetical protein
MGATLWMLAIDKNKKLHRLPLTIYEGKKTKIKNEVVKAIELIIINENRRPVKIKRHIYYQLKFNNDGTLDNNYYEEMTNLHLSSLNMLGEGLTNDQVLSKIKYDTKYFWTPSVKEIKLINQYLNQKGLPLCELLTYNQY